MANQINLQSDNVRASLRENYIYIFGLLAKFVLTSDDLTAHLQRWSNVLNVTLIRCVSIDHGIAHIGFAIVNLSIGNLTILKKN